MKPHHLLLAFAVFGITAMSDAAVTPVLVIHGGAGVVKHDLTPAKEQAIRAAMTLALQRPAQGRQECAGCRDDSADRAGG